MKIRSLVTVWLLVGHSAGAQTTNLTFDAAWKSVRDKQPPGLSLQLSVAKTNFFQGEIISAALTFKNTSESKYFLWTGNYDRAGRIPDISFVAEDKAGRLVEDPLQWYFGGGLSMGGLGGHQNLGQWGMGLSANQWLRFDRPGTYRVFARSHRVLKGNKDDEPRPLHESVELVSDIIEIEITPLTAEREKERLAEIEADLARNDETSRGASERLRHLTSPAARELRLRELQGKQGFAAAMGFFAMPDLHAEAQFLLDAAMRPDVAVTSEYLWAYRSLKLHSATPSIQTIREAKEELLRKARQALPNKRGPAFTRTLETLFTENPKDPDARAMLVKHQEELAPDRVEWLLHSWDRLGGPEFLPMLRKAVQPPHNSALALGKLSQLAPDEAKKMILEDITQPKSRFLRPASDQFDVLEMLKLPDHEIPEVDDIFRRKFQEKPSNAYSLMPLVTRYATTNLLPEVIAVYLKHEGKWACRFQNYALQYWIRCDAKDGLEALRRAVAARASTGCYRRTVSEVLLDHWVEDAVPLVVSVLNDTDPDVVASAGQVLARYAPETVAPEFIAAVERLTASSDNPKSRERGWAASRMIDDLMRNKTWTLTPDQYERLLKATKDPVRQAQIKKRIEELPKP